MTTIAAIAIVKSSRVKIISLKAFGILFISPLISLSKPIRKVVVFDVLLINKSCQAAMLDAQS